jgi:Ni/Fe-hydrogenase subunit HybB-like protein
MFLSKLLTEMQRIPRYAYILAALTVLGMSAGLYRLYAGLGATTHMSKVFPWGSVST